MDSGRAWRAACRYAESEGTRVWNRRDPAFFAWLGGTRRNAPLDLPAQSRCWRLAVTISLAVA